MRYLRVLLLFLFVVMQSNIPVAAAPLAQETPDATHAPLSSAFTYQGRLEKGGQLVTAQCSMTFTLFDALIGGNQVGNSQTLNPVSISAGLFTVALNANGEFGGNAFEGSTRFLEIAVLCPGDSSATLLPRQPLTAAPYAITSLSTEALQGHAVSTVAPALGQVLAWDGTQWTPQSTGNGALLDWNNLSGIPAGFADNEDNEAAAPDWNSITNLPPDFADNVDNDAGGDITGVLVGNGLTGGGNAGQVALALDLNVTDSLYWRVHGNANVPTNAFLGTTNATTMTLGTNNAPALRLAPAVDSLDASPVPNIIGGVESNSVSPGVIGATIAGGGRSSNEQPNLAHDSFGAIGGGTGNRTGTHDGDPFTQSFATVAGGTHNHATGAFTTIPGGKLGLAHLPGQFAYAAGGFDNTPGSAQMAIYILRTEGLGPRTLLLENNQLLAIRPGVTMLYTIQLVGRSVDGTTIAAAYRLDGMISASDEGGAATISVPVVTTLFETIPFGNNLAPSINTTGGTLNIVASNQTGESMRWVATVYATEIAE